MKDGFFTKKQTDSKSRPDGKTYSCASCGLYKGVNCPRMKPFGNFKKGILNIGEAPGKTEDERGKQWQGKTGRLLKVTYRRLGVDLFEDCLNVNAVNCRPPNNRAPTNYEMDCCRRTILKIIDEYQPQMIVLLGGSALYSLLGHRWKKSLEGISKWRGWNIPDRDFKAWVCPIFHPSFVERSDSKEVETIWEQDLKRIANHVNIRLPKYKNPRIEIIEDLSVLNDLKCSLSSFDYETTGLKPQAPGHRIVCASIAVDENHCYSFMMPKKKKKRLPFINFIANPHIGKMAHSIKFEETWSVVRLKQSVANWEWDSMLAAHTLDNRPGITSLKFQTYVQFGVIDYSSEIEPYLKAIDNKNGNAHNRIYEFLKLPDGEKKLLQYCGLDSIYEYRLAMLQIDKIGYSFLPL